MLPSFKPEIPADVPTSAEKDYIVNYATITRNTGKLFLFACDQKIEHLNTDFYGSDISPDALDPEHLFRIGTQAPIGAMATQLGLIARYGKKYPTIPYIAKLNATTHLVKSEQRDPESPLLWTVNDAITMKKNTGLSIRGIGFTIYLGSAYEPEMLATAAQLVYEAHQEGLVTILWIYPRGKSIIDESDPQLLAGAAGVACALGSDFVKIKAPEKAENLATITAAAGNTQVICSGGKQVPVGNFLTSLHAQLHQGTTGGTATGRNLFQKSLREALALADAIAALTFEGKEADQGYKLYQQALAK